VLRRGFGPSCEGRGMADTAAHLVDRVLPEIAIRQWVLTLPYPLRYRYANDARLSSEVLRAFLRSLFAEFRRRARDRWDEQCGSLTFIQRFGSALNLNVHSHPGARRRLLCCARFTPSRLPVNEDCALQGSALGEASTATQSGDWTLRDRAFFAVPSRRLYGNLATLCMNGV
jgi:hypothetical protein